MCCHSIEKRVYKRLVMQKRQYLFKGGGLTLIKSTFSRFLFVKSLLLSCAKRVSLRLGKFSKGLLVEWGFFKEKTVSSEMGYCLYGINLMKILVLESFPFSKALLGKWLWRFASENESLWKRIIVRKYGEEERGWYTRESRDGYRVGLQKAIRSG